MHQVCVLTPRLSVMKNEGETGHQIEIKLKERKSKRYTYVYEVYEVSVLSVDEIC